MSDFPRSRILSAYLWGSVGPYTAVPPSRLRCGGDVFRGRWRAHHLLWTVAEFASYRGKSSIRWGCIAMRKHSKWSRQRFGTVTLVAVAAAMVALIAPMQSSAAVTAPRSVTSYAPPGVGAYWRNTLKTHNQVIVADGVGESTKVIKLTLWTYIGDNKWRNDGAYTGIGGTSGWNKTKQGDRRTPTGVFGLTDAGGYYPNPGTRLRYEYSHSKYSFIVQNARVFSYVLAINYNHVVGTPPSSTRTTMGYAKGTKIWLHERHKSGSAGCIGTTRAGMVRILRWVNPAAHPVIIMGPQ